MASSKVYAGLVLVLLAFGCSGRPEPGAVSPAMKQMIREHTRTDHQGLEVVRNADGSMSVDLRGRFRSVPVAWIDEQGRTRISESVLSSPLSGSEQDSE